MSTNFQLDRDSVPLMQCMPELIQFYSVQETELVVIAKGGDTFALQVAVACGGTFVGALPNAIVGLQQYLSTTPHLEAGNFVALMLAFGSLLGCALGACIHRKQRTYPDLLLKEILSRKNPQALVK